MAAEGTCLLCNPRAGGEAAARDAQEIAVLSCERCGTYAITPGGRAALADHPEAARMLRRAVETAPGDEAFLIESLTVTWAAGFERSPIGSGEPMRGDGDAPEPGEVVSVSTLDALARKAAAAFSVDPAGRIVYWSEGAERILGRRRAEAQGCACYELLGGRDLFGNRYCSASCPIRSVTSAGAEAKPFLANVKGGDAGRLTVRMRTVALPEPGPRFTSLVHLVDPGNEERLEDLLKGLRATAASRPGASSGGSGPAGNPLSAREQEIMLLLSNGFLSVNIAARLGLSRATVRNHIQNILKKLDVHGQVEAISVALRRGWV